MLISQTAHLLVLLAKQPVEIVAIFRTNVRWHRTYYRVNHLLIKGRLPVHVVVLSLFFHMHFLINFFRPDCWYLLCRSRWTAAFVMRLCCWRFLVCLVTAWCLLALARWTATTMTSGASATQQAMAWSGQSAVHFFSFLFCLFWPASGQTSCLSLRRALKAGMQRPLLVCPPHKDYPNSGTVAALGALHALYMVRRALKWRTQSLCQHF